MSGFKKLLVPLDGSRLAEAVLPATKLLAERFHATISLLHVLEQGAPEAVHGEAHLADVQQAEAYLEQVAEQCACDGVVVERHVHPNQERDVVASIIGHAQEFGADLILLSTHGWGGMRDILVGSIAQQVLRRGSLPVWLVKPVAPDGPPSFKPEKLLVPLDGTPTHDGAVLPLVEQLAAVLGSSVHLLVVVPTLGTVRGDQAAVAILTPSATAAALDMERDEARAYLEGVGARLTASGASVTAEVRRGDPVNAVVERAESTEADLIVMSTHGRSGLDAFWSGSVGAKILSRVQQPLLLVKVED